MLIFQSDAILQKTDWSEKRWTLADVLESPNPFFGEPLAERNAAIKKVVERSGQIPGELSETARLHLDFWKNFRPQKISSFQPNYPFELDSSSRFELTINDAGLFFKDVSNRYGNGPIPASEQLFSDFWFYGPYEPIPDLMLRKKMIDLLQNAFSSRSCPSAQAHFELFEYPKKSPEGLHWTEGNYVRSDYLTVRNFGIEMGHTTFRDGPSGPGFLSFERFLNLPPGELRYITPEMREKTEAYLGKTSRHSPPKPAETEPKPLSPREKLDLTESLLKDPASEEGAELMISLLEYDAQTDYWRNYVFTRCANLRENRRVRAFIAGCLRGDNEMWFKKSRDVLAHWGFFMGDKALADRALLNALNWEDAAANDPDFRAALEKILKIINP